MSTFERCMTPQQKEDFDLLERAARHLDIEFEVFTLYGGREVVFMVGGREYSWDQFSDLLTTGLRQKSIDRFNAEKNSSLLVYDEIARDNGELA